MIEKDRYNHKVNYLNKWNLYRHWKIELTSDIIKILKN